MQGSLHVNKPIDRVTRKPPKWRNEHVARAHVLFADKAVKRILYRHPADRSVGT